MIAAAQGQELARKNLENYMDLFTAETRETGMEHAKEVVAMIHPRFVDMQALDCRDMDY